MVKIAEDLWCWHHNVSECYYHIQLAIKYRRSIKKGDCRDYVRIQGTVSGRGGDRRIIENYIKKQGREEDIKQLKLLELKTPCALGTG